MPIELETNPDVQLTIFKASGKITESDAIASLRIFYEGNPTINVILDMHEADLSEMGVAGIQRIIGFISKYVHLRKGGKTALVSKKDLVYGLSRMAEALIPRSVVKYRAFRSTEEAHEWLKPE